MKSYNATPTSTSLVAETIRRSLRIASDGQNENISVTYDLAIAKLAMQIQAEGKTTFDKIFISLRSFHPEMTFFPAIGKIIEESSGPHILDECKILAKASINSFLRGKSYKRCKRMHELLALALEIIHFESYLTTRNADAASQRTGISPMTNSKSARQRWAEFHFLRTTVISYLNED